MISLPELAIFCQLMSGAAEPTPAERELWAALAAEINQYLQPDDEPALFDTNKGEAL